MTPRKRLVTLIAILAVAALSAGITACLSLRKPVAPPPVGAVMPTYDDMAKAVAGFGEDVNYEAPDVTIDPKVGADFDVKSIRNVADMEKAYGVTFSPADLQTLADRKFVMKRLTDTSIRPGSEGDNLREFIQLYARIAGPRDPKARAPENAVFYSSDVFFHSFNNVYTELLKEMENKAFYPSMTALSASMYKAADAKRKAATTDADIRTWTEVRNYFAVPYAILSTAAQPLSEADYRSADGMKDPAAVMAAFEEKDAKIDTYDSVAAFIGQLDLDAPSRAAVLSDLKTVYDAKGAAVPAVFAEDYAAYAADTGIGFSVDFTQFTPRGTYTSSSLRRQYFRGMKWYIMLPFFLKSPQLTTDAFAVTQLLAEQPQGLEAYDKLEAAIDFLVGASDDLMPADYLQALAAGKGQADPSAAAMDFLVKARDPKIKDLTAGYPEVGLERSDDVRIKTKGLRFFSGKFIIDSYWTGYLTQGDEGLRPGYTQKLPPMASSLEVMGLLGSEYAKSQIPKLDFYKPTTREAVDKAMGQLADEEAKLTDADWRKNVYTGWLWTIKGLFAWTQEKKAGLPRFMQSVAWEAKTLQTATAWWTELRHATILYAKQSFAELGGGGDGCDTRKIPPPPKAYIEPQPVAYARLSYLAKRLDKGLKDQGFELQNLGPLENLIGLMDLVQPYVQKELADDALHEEIVSNEGPDPDDPAKTCLTYRFDGDSDWETLRVTLMDKLKASIPWPVEGPVLSAKDRRAALVADVHTGQDSSYPAHILYEGTGVPAVIFTAVSDANGPRLTAGFASTQYEFTRPYGGQRMTDEDWQKNFYAGDDPYDAFKYTDSMTWPAINPWYATLFGGK